MSSKSILVILSYTVSKSERFLRHSECTCNMVCYGQSIETIAGYGGIVPRQIVRKTDDKQTL